jgi:hypothetical protein
VAPPPAGGLKKLKTLDLGEAQVTDAGCASLAAALDSGALPALEDLRLDLTPASAAAKEAVREAMARSRAAAIASEAEREAMAKQALESCPAALP